MPAEGDDVSELGRFSAREFLARWTRETGEVPDAASLDRMLFSHEIGYMRGYAEGYRKAYEEAIQKLKQGEPKT